MKPSQGEGVPEGLLSGAILQQNPNDIGNNQPLILPPTARENTNSQWEQDSQDIIEMVERTLRGHKRKKDGSWDTSHEKEFRKMNDKGIFDVVLGLQFLLTKNTYQSNIDEQKTYEQIRCYSIDLAGLLADNFIVYEMKPEYLDYVHELLVQIIAAAYFRQMGGGERIIRGQQISEQRIIRQDMPMNIPQEKKKNGIFGLGFAGL
jgi:hypothetical protein